MNSEVSILKHGLKEFRDYAHWRKLTDQKNRPFRSWESYVAAREPYGLEMSPALVERVIGEPDERRPLEDVLGQLPKLSVDELKAVIEEAERLCRRP